MQQRNYKSSIPAGAREVVEEFHDTGAKKSASYFVGGDKVGLRAWYADGTLEYEFAYREGVRHGLYRDFYQNGQLLEVQPYRDGKLHGTGRQWSEDGRLLVTWKMVHNAGLDLWCDTLSETLAEETYWPRDGELGYHREWNKDEKTIWQEYFYILGKGYHGAWREWNKAGRPRRGFPRYFVNDRRVTKRQYLTACKVDPTLPLYRPEDDDPHRELPTEYVAQRKTRQGRKG